MTNSKYFKSSNKKLNELNKDKAVFKTGNLKIGYNTLIFNLGPAKKCISAKLGLCQLKNHKTCYAYRDECRYPTVLKYRNRQLKYWDKSSVHQFILDVGTIIKKSRVKIKYLRFNESGDIRHLNDLHKINFIAKWLKREYDITTYLYTARKDLINQLKQVKNVIINGSGFMVHNNFTAVYYFTGKNICPANCGSCTKCKTRNFKQIEVLIH